MTEREKLVEIIAPFVSAYGEDEAIADALIDAGIGDVSRRGQRYNKKIKRLKKTIVRNEEAAREAIYQRTKRAEAAEHRAEVAEGALLWLCDKTLSGISILVLRYNGEPTLITRGSGTVCDIRKVLPVRRLTPAECARLQGKPDWWCADIPHADTPELLEEVEE